LSGWSAGGSCHPGNKAAKALAFPAMKIYTEGKSESKQVQTSPNKSKLLALLETQYTCSNLTQADTNDEMNRFFQFCP
jgi:hypothetical protein